MLSFYGCNRRTIGAILTLFTSMIDGVDGPSSCYKSNYRFPDVRILVHNDANEPIVGQSLVSVAKRNFYRRAAKDAKELLWYALRSLRLCGKVFRFRHKN